MLTGRTLQRRCVTQHRDIRRRAVASNPTSYTSAFEGRDIPGAAATDLGEMALCGCAEKSEATAAAAA